MLKSLLTPFTVKSAVTGIFLPLATFKHITELPESPMPLSSVILMGYFPTADFCILSKMKMKSYSSFHHFLRSILRSILYTALKNYSNVMKQKVPFVVQVVNFVVQPPYDLKNIKIPNLETV